MNRNAKTIAFLVLVFAAAALQSATPENKCRQEELTLAGDGVWIDPEGNPHYATFSICAVDRETGECGVAVTTRVPFVGRAVPWVRAGVGAVATQAWTVVEYGRQGLDLLEQGLEPQKVLEQLLADDKDSERRQLGIIDMKGRTAAHTGKGNGKWAGSRQGVDYTVQGNILVGQEVIDAVADHLESAAGTSMPFAERMILAMEAGQAKGGDKRWGRFQSAAIRIADPNVEGRGGDHISLAINVGEHPTPIAEMKRIYYKTAARLGYRSFSEIKGNDVIELKRILHALGYWGKDLDKFPEPPSQESRPDDSLRRTDPEAWRAAWSDFRKAYTEYYDKYSRYDDEAMDAVDAFRKDKGMVYSGNPRGLVDERFVKALKQAYYFERGKTKAQIDSKTDQH